MSYIKRFCQCPTHATIFNIEEVEKTKINSSENITLFFYDDLEQAREYIFNNLCEDDRMINITEMTTEIRHPEESYQANVVEVSYGNAIQDMSFNVLRMRSNHIMLEDPKSRFMSLELDFINMGHKLFIAIPKEENDDSDVSELVYSLWDSLPEKSYQKQLFFHYLGNFSSEHPERNPFNSIKIGVEVFNQTKQEVDSYFLTAPYAYAEMK